MASGFSVVTVPSGVWKNKLELSGNRSSKVYLTSYFFVSDIKSGTFDLTKQYSNAYDRTIADCLLQNYFLPLVIF